MDTVNVTNFTAKTGLNSSLNVANSLNQWLPLQISLATLALIPNTLIAMVFFIDRRLLKESALICGYVGGNITVVIACACSIGYQFFLYFRHEASNQTNIIISCLCTFAPHLLWLSFATKALFLFAFGADRLTAVAAAAWYHKTWTQRTSWRVTGLIYICACVSVGATWIDGSIAQMSANQSTQSCISQAFASNSSFIYGLVLKILGGSVCVVTTLISLTLCQKNMKKMNSSSSEAAKRMKKQLALIKTMLILASFDVLLVVIPNTLLLLDFTIHLNLPSYIALAGPLACCVNTAVSAVTLLVFNSKIRRSAAKLLKLEESSLMTCVTPGKTTVSSISVSKTNG